jgi:rhodanese-related sulfurtransferase
MTRTISPAQAAELVESKAALLIDIREPSEHARENIAGAHLVPLSRIGAHDFVPLKAQAPTAIFHCQGGNRTGANAAQLVQCGFERTYLLEGGIAGWKAAGLPTRLDPRQPIELQRQVQIAAGAIILLGLLLAVAVSPWFAVVIGFVGGGLLFAGLSGWCGMARLLRAMPWNKVAAS